MLFPTQTRPGDRACRACTLALKEADFQVRLSIDLWSVSHRETSSATFCLGELTAYVISARAFSIPVNLAWAVARTTEVRYLR